MNDASATATAKLQEITMRRFRYILSLLAISLLLWPLLGSCFRYVPADLEVSPETHDPYKGFGEVGDPTVTSDEEALALIKRYEAAYAALTPEQREHVEHGRLAFNGYHFVLVPFSDN